jgi:hypothetical protein
MKEEGIIFKKKTKNYITDFLSLSSAGLQNAQIWLKSQI